MLNSMLYFLNPRKIKNTAAHSGTNISEGMCTILYIKKTVLYKFVSHCSASINLYPFLKICLRHVKEVCNFRSLAFHPWELDRDGRSGFQN